MKKVFYILLIMLLMPTVTYAKNIEITSITENNEYSDITVELSDSSNAVINFNVDGTTFTEDTKYNIVIKNNTNDTYSLDLSNLNKLDYMTVTSNKNSITPGDNNIELTIQRKNINIKFLSDTSEDSDSSLILDIQKTNTSSNNNTTNNNTTTNNLENPNTGESILKILVISGTLILIAVLLFLKTKRTSSFFILLLITFVPTIINASEDNTIKIKINTIVSPLSYTTCFYNDTETRNYTFKNLNYRFNINDNQDLLQELFATSTVLTKDNILDFLRNEEDSNLFDKTTLNNHLNLVNFETGELPDVDGEENLGIAFYDSYRNATYTTVYNETDDILEVNTKITRASTESTTYKVQSMKVTFNKYNDDFIVEVYNNYYQPIGSFVIVSEEGYAYDKMNSKTIPLINLKTYLEQLEEDAGTIVTNGVSRSGSETYTVDGQTISFDDLITHTYEKEVYIHEYNNEIHYFVPQISTMKDEMVLTGKSMFKVQPGSNYYTLESGYIKTDGSFSGTTEETLNVYHNILGRYLVLVRNNYACYQFKNKIYM